MPPLTQQQGMCFFSPGSVAIVGASTKTGPKAYNLLENLLREELNPMEEARAYARLMEVNGWNGKQVAESLHIPTSKVSRCLAMLKLRRRSSSLSPRVRSRRVRLMSCRRSRTSTE